MASYVVRVVQPCNASIQWEVNAGAIVIIMRDSGREPHEPYLPGIALASISPPNFGQAQLASCKGFRTWTMLLTCFIRNVNIDFQAVWDMQKLC